MTASGAVRDSYVAAIQHDLVDLDGDEFLAGVVRRPTPWFHGAIDENFRALGPPESLLEEAKRREEDFKRRGVCESGAVNAAWEDVGFADRYREYLSESDDAGAAIEALEDRLGDGQDVVLVCYEGEDKRCHRRILRELLGGEPVGSDSPSGERQTDT